MISFKIILCVDSKYGYSKDNTIPWASDMKGIKNNEYNNFKTLTTSNFEKTLEYKNVLLMGKKTWSDIISKGHNNVFNILKTRDIIVLSKDKNIVPDSFSNKIVVIDNLWDSLIYIHNTYRLISSNIWICGGASIWYEFIKLKIVDTIYISHIYKDYKCDKYVDKYLLLKNFELIHSDESNTLFSIDTYKYYNKEECKYLETIQKIICKGYQSMDRSGVGTFSIFGKSFTYDIRNYRLPLFTHRKMFLRGIIEELLFFISGETDTKILEKKGVNIWKTHTSASFLHKRKLNLNEGDYGPSYGFQLRKWGSDGITNGFDQLQYVINLLNTDPHSRRIVFSYWNPEYLDKVPLPPCHILYMFNVNDKNELSCSFTQRSNDFALAGNFNICSASILVFILCKICELKPGKIVHNIGNIHLYKNQIEYINKFIDNKPYNAPLINVKKKENAEDYDITDFTLMFYKSHVKYFIPISE